MPFRVLIAVDRPALGERAEKLLAGNGTLVTQTVQPRSLLEEAGGREFDLILASRTLLAPRAAAMVDPIRRMPERPEIIVLADREDPEDRASLLAAGCLAVLNVELPDSMLKGALDTLVRRRQEQLHDRLSAHRATERRTLDDFASNSTAMRNFLEVARRVAPTDTSLLILGETGVGKERLARAIHLESPRATGPFIAVNCGALPESLLESELFGHERGAFTGAVRPRRGYFELADGGTIFLDEIGELPLHVQVKLLRVLENSRVQRVGGESEIAIDVRIMAATNRDVEADVEAKRFRPDLYYRLAVVTLTLPPLRDRREDVPALVDVYVDELARHLSRPICGVDPEALAALCGYEWPGNVRELINVIERAVLLCPSTRIGIEDLPRRVAAAVKPTPPAHAGQLAPAIDDDLLSRPLREARELWVAVFEREYLTRLLQETGGRVGEAARRAGINPRFLYELMKRYGLTKSAFK